MNFIYENDLHWPKMKEGIMRHGSTNICACQYTCSHTCTWAMKTHKCIFLLYFKYNALSIIPWHSQRYSLELALAFWVTYNNNVDIMRFYWGIHGEAYIKSLEQCLTIGKHTEVETVINTQCHPLDSSIF